MPIIFNPTDLLKHLTDEEIKQLQGFYKNNNAPTDLFDDEEARRAKEASQKE
jgi:hypothetical protein